MSKKYDAEPMILDSDPEAAAYRTDISGWVSKNGRFFGDDEQLARYDGCTHRACEDCGAPAAKSYLVCNGCRGQWEVKRYLAMPTKEWDGEGYVYSQVADEYFDADQLAEYCDENGVTPNDLRLVICEPEYAHEADPESLFGDQLPEDGELPDELQEALDTFNKAIREYGIPLSWLPGRFSMLEARKK